ncbi:hypothetical protein C7401_12454 [Paraburkholderia unamae]|nr:hypothetical protein C7401_12454 [Paraburkholderia unamae]
MSCAWWGSERVKGQRPLGLARPQYHGLVFAGLRQFLVGRPLIGAVIELGTRGRDVAMALTVDSWMRFWRPYARRQDPVRDRILRRYDRHVSAGIADLA